MILEGLQRWKRQNRMRISQKVFPEPKYRQKGGTCQGIGDDLCVYLVPYLKMLLIQHHHSYFYAGLRGGEVNRDESLATNLFIQDPPDRLGHIAFEKGF